jgi:hypothetical protein
MWLVNKRKETGLLDADDKIVVVDPLSQFINSTLKNAPLIVTHNCDGDNSQCQQRGDKDQQRKLNSNWDSHCDLRSGPPRPDGTLDLLGKSHGPRLTADSSGCNCSAVSSYKNMPSLSLLDLL